MSKFLSSDVSIRHSGITLSSLPATNKHVKGQIFKLKKRERMNKKKKKMTDLKEGIELRKRSSQAISVRVGFLGLSVGNLYGIVHAL